MKFGAMVATKIDDWQLLQYAEQLGYDHGWVPDSQMIWSDCYAVLALAAHHTSRIRLGTGVAVAGTRSAPVTAHSIASINRIAPGRVFLGIGTGHTAMRVMGFDPVPPREFREYLRVVRGLLHGEEVEYTQRGETRAIRFLHRELGFVDVAHEIPIWVAANGPLALAAAGAHGDGRVSAGAESFDSLQRSLAAIRDGAAKSGRTLPDSFHTAALTFSCVLRPGEKLTSDRVIDAVGSMASATLHYWWELAQKAGSDHFVPAAVRDTWEQYLRYLDGLGIPRDHLHLRVHDGHCTYLVPEERRFITPELIRASGGLVGEPDEILAMLREHERAGLREVTLLPPMANARELLREFATLVMEKAR
jgi:alkanesulfonate monooxygenase SsuD/methylene tetrahydromethanopterin reductase-like flavin-dependent oxidoreductase (luciferase family)